MPVHTTVEDDIHSFETHQIKQLIFLDQQSIPIYTIAEHKAASFVARIDNGTNTMKLIVDLVDDGTGVGIDVRQIPVGGDSNLIPYSITATILTGNVVLTIQNPVPAETNTLKYYVIPSNL